MAGGDIGVIYGAAPARGSHPTQPASAGQGGPAVPAGFHGLFAPATTVKLKQSLGALSLAALIRDVIKQAN